MKLSEAILNGCEGTYKVTEALFEGYFNRIPPKGCCALGAAIFGIGWEKYTEDTNAQFIEPEEFISKYIEGITPETPTPIRMVKRVGVSGGCLFSTIVLMNDYTEWTREDIAKLLAECGY